MLKLEQELVRDAQTELELVCVMLKLDHVRAYACDAQTGGRPVAHFA